MSDTPNRSPLTLIAILAVVIALGIGGVAVFLNKPSVGSAPDQPGPGQLTPGQSATNQPAPAANDPILGDVSHFDPIGTYPAIAKYAGSNLQLSSINIYFVRSDGTLDLTASYKPHVYYYFFQNLDTPPSDAPPIGAGGKLNEKWYQPVSVDVRAPENAGDKPSVDRYDTKPTNEKQHLISPPTCSLKKFWSVALEKGAPRNAVATVDYNFDGYYFAISDTSLRLEFTADCQYIRGTGLTPEPTETESAQSAG